MTRVLLFDIDGTLIHTGRAGVRALERAFAEEFAVDEALGGMSLAGRTDRGIIVEVLQRHVPEHVVEESWLLAFRDRYLHHLAAEIQMDHPGKQVLPGVVELLDQLRGRDDVHVALLTGNFERGAAIKLQHFALWERFAWGAYGDASVDRNALFPIAMEEIRSRAGYDIRPQDVWIIGDTPHDVACAKAGGGRVLAVATGPFDVDALHATGADHVVPDLVDTADIVNRLLQP